MSENRRRLKDKVIIAGISIGMIMATVGGITLGNSVIAKRHAEIEFNVQVSQKASDAEWLYRLGEISDEEWDALKNFSAQKPTLQQLDEYLDDLLGNRKEEYFTKWFMQ